MTAVDLSSSPGGQLERIPLSANLELFCMFDKGDAEGAFGPRNLIIQAWRVLGELDIEAMRGALDNVVERHEILRTEIVRSEADEYQRVHPASPVEVVVVDLPPAGQSSESSRDERVDEFLNQIERTKLNVASLPHLRAVIGRFDREDAVLVLVTHHVTSDLWSLQVLIKEIAAGYAERTGGPQADLPEPVQYGEFSTWQQGYLASAEAERARNYWRDKLSGAQMFGLEMDKPAGVSAGYAVHRFVFPNELAESVHQLVKALRVSPFMVSLAGFMALLHKMTGATDVVGATISAGRGEERFANSVGAFFNLVPLRTDLGTCRSFSDLVLRTRSTCLEAYANEFPFSEISAVAPELNKPYEAGDAAVCTLQVVQSPDELNSTTIGDLTYTEVRRRFRSNPDTHEIPNGILLQLDLMESGEIAGLVKYNRAEFLPATLAKLVDDYREILAKATANPAIPLGEL